VTGDLRILFKKVDYTLDNLLTYIEIGDIGLPDIQRPFVWATAKVRDLFDSMYRGFPVGYLLFWSNEVLSGTRQIGTGEKVHAPKLLIVDGQQRLTSLFAVFRGKEIIDADYKRARLEIAFRPRDGKFEVTDIAIRRDPEFIPSISEMWTSRSTSYSLIGAFLRRLRERREVTADEEDVIAHNIDRLFDLQKYPFTALEIASSVDEEHVAEIFVRINSQGVKLNQSDFILTLMSVFWDEGRVALEEFCRRARSAPDRDTGASPFNHFIHPDPDHLLRVAVALGFRRGRLKSVYQLLRGKDLETEQFSSEHRDRQFSILRDAQAKVLNLTHWHQFFTVLVEAGYRGAEQISSDNTLMFGYALQLIGKLQFDAAQHVLSRVIGRWFTFASMTGRYTGSYETRFEADLAFLRDVRDAAGFVALLERIMADTLTHDYWTTTLPSELETSSASSPLLFAFLAAQIKLGAPVLFSRKKVADLFDPMLRVKMKSTNKHHLFPKAWLEKQGMSGKREINQIANLAITEWPDNLEISDGAPAVYLPIMRGRFSDEEWAAMHEFHALPADWASMTYNDFLIERRKLMAKVIRLSWETVDARK
jgi:hypothetical protein